MGAPVVVEESPAYVMQAMQSDGEVSILHLSWNGGGVDAFLTDPVAGEAISGTALTDRPAPSAGVIGDTPASGPRLLEAWRMLAE